MILIFCRHLPLLEMVVRASRPLLQIMIVPQASTTTNATTTNATATTNDTSQESGVEAGETAAGTTIAIPAGAFSSRKP